MNAAERINQKNRALHLINTSASVAPRRAVRPAHHSIIYAHRLAAALALITILLLVLLLGDFR
jgi:hypothetical protein